LAPEYQTLAFNRKSDGRSVRMSRGGVDFEMIAVGAAVA
jgi:hypothetical protein